MPIRIREVHIKATVADEKEETSKEKQPVPPAGDAVDVQEIVALCVAQVMRRLKKMEER